MLYFDLDVDIVGDIQKIADYPGFACSRDFLNPRINSSVMVWDAGTQDHLFKRFHPNMMGDFMGDQDFINKYSLPSKLPKTWCISYKYCQRTRDTKVIYYNGNPKPWEL